MLKRVLTAIVAGGISLAALLAPDSRFFLAWCVVAGIACALELGSKESPPWERLAYVLLAAGFAVAAHLCILYLEASMVALTLVIAVPTLLAWWCLATNRMRFFWPATIGIAFACLEVLRFFVIDGYGPLIVLSMAVIAWIPLWVGDSAAYFVGKAFGKHKMAPKISPNKTWEGALANLGGCLIAAMAFGWIPDIDLGFLLMVGLIAGTFGQAGDLLQSSWKRKQNRKDSSGLLPGHGGVLDRLDSLLFSVPFTTLLLLGF